MKMKRIAQTLLLSALLVCQSAWALSLGEAKAKKLVGETPSGYLAPVNAQSDAVNALVRSINAKRKAQYEQIAKKRGAPLSEVEKLAGKTAIEKTARGHMIKIGGKWKVK